MQEKRHHGQINSKNGEIADLREEAVKREEKWNQQWSNMERENDQHLRNKADEFARLDKWYHDELAAEKDRNRREVTDLRAQHANELAKRDQAFKQQEDRFLAQLR